jgi:hypothetical protein
MNYEIVLQHRFEAISESAVHDRLCVCVCVERELITNVSKKRDVNTVDNDNDEVRRAATR